MSISKETFSVEFPDAGFTSEAFSGSFDSPLVAFRFCGLAQDDRWKWSSSKQKHYRPTEQYPSRNLSALARCAILGCVLVRLSMHSLSRAAPTISNSECRVPSQRSHDFCRVRLRVKPDFRQAVTHGPAWRRR